MIKNRLFPSVLFIGAMITLGLTLGLGMPALAQEASSDGHPAVTVTHAWARPAIAGGTGAVYFEITNLGASEIVMTEATSDVARVVEIHQTVLIHDSDQDLLHNDDDHMHHHDDHAHHHDHHMDEHDHHHDHHADHHDHDMHMGHGAGGTFVMLHVEKLPIGAGEQVLFEPAGYHIMLIDLYETLAWGSTFSMTLYFDDGSAVVVPVAVGDQPAH